MHAFIKEMRLNVILGKMRKGKLFKLNTPPHIRFMTHMINMYMHKLTNADVLNIETRP